MRSAVIVAATVLALPSFGHAQALSCTAPTRVGPIRPELPSTDQPARVLPIGGYTLALTWSPEFCHGHARDAAARFQCGGGDRRFGFTLHGLWPDGVGPVWPQYCKAAALLPAALVHQHLCATPSAQLMQHEWAKHGTCTGDDPAAYFRRSTGLYGRLRFPDMAALARRRTVTAGQLAEAVAAANPGIGPTAIRVTANRQGWLDELWLCLDRRLAYARCRPGSGGVAASTKIRIAAPAR